MKHLFSCLKRYTKEGILAPLFKLFEASLELIVPLVVGAIVNNGINGVGGADKSYVVFGCLILIAFGAVGLAFAMTAQFFAARAAVGVSAELRKRLFSKIQSLSYAQIDELGTSTMITRMTSDVNQVQTGVNMTLRIFLRSPIVVFGAMAMAFVVDVKVALVFVAVIPLLMLVVFAVMAACIPLYQRVQQRLDKVFLSTRENLAGARVIRAFCLEESEIEEFEQRSAALTKSQKKVGHIAALTNPLTYILINVAVIALLYFSGLRVHSGALEQGDVISLYSYLSLVLVELVKFANLIVTITKAVSCQKRLGAVLDMQSERDTLPCQTEGDQDCAVQFDKVTFSYHKEGEPSLQNISLCVSKGETVGVLGGTGAGKSTLVHLIPRFYTVEEGAVYLGGVNVNAIPTAQLRERVGIVPQKAVLFKGSIRSNLLWGKGDATEEELLSACRLAQADDVLTAKGGLDGEIAQDGKNLSGGQRQRLTIARALVKKPEVLILDDSASALDYATDARLRAALKTLDCTTFIVSQRIASVQNADRILLLDDGEAVAIGTHEELLQNCQLYGEIYRTQFKEGE